MKPRGYAATSMGDVYPLDQEWLWYNRIPTAEITIISAAGGTGKGLLSAWLIAALSNGWNLPDSPPRPDRPMGILWASTEDDRNVTMANRLIANGANMDAVGDISTVNGQPFSLPDDMPRLMEAVDNQTKTGYTTGAIILDPLSVIAMGQIGTVRNVRKVMTPLQQFVNDTGIPIIFIHHVNKDGKVNGSKAVMDSVRSVLLLSREKNNPNVRTLHVEKSNGGDDTAPDLSFTIEGEGSDTHIQWVTNPDDNSDVGLDAIAKLLKGSSALSTRDVSVKLNIPYGTTRVMLARLTGQGRIHEIMSGYYAGGAPE